MSRYFQLIETAIVMMIIAIAIMPASATIINIPDDYLTIQEGIDASSDGDTVLVQPGWYMGSLNFNGHSIVLASLYILYDDSYYIDSTIIYTGLSRSDKLITFESGEDSTCAIIGFRIEGTYLWPDGGAIYCSNGSEPFISNNIFYHCYGEFSGGIRCYESNPKIYSNTFLNNWSGGMFPGKGGAIGLFSAEPVIADNVFYSGGSTHYGGAIYCSTSDPLIQNNIFYENQSASGGALYLDQSSPSIINNVFYNNHADTAYGGALCCVNQSNPLIINNIIRYNSAPEGAQLYVDDSSLLEVFYCNIEGGWPGIENIDVDPLFRDPENGDFHLMATYCGDPYDSPCIDMGHPDISDSLLDCAWGLGELRSDMGAYGGSEGYVNIDYEETIIPDKFSISQNYPNPFNASTTISYTLPYQSDVAIDIYDILGRKVQTLVSRHQPAGYHRVLWQADEFSSGMYFYKLQAGDYIETKKMMLLK